MAVCATPLLMGCGLKAQLVDAPQPALQQQAPGQGNGPSQTQRKPIFSFFPDLSTEPVDEKLPAQTAGEKFMLPTRNTLNAVALAKPAFAAGFKEWWNTTPEFGHGSTGFGRYYWHTFLDETSETYMVEFVFPVLTHQDARYYSLGKGGFWRRTEYALSRTLVTRNDAGKAVFNSSEVAGAGAAAGLTNLYYPGGKRTASITAQRWGLNVGFDAFGYAAREFWPDVNKKVFGGKL
jgi:hypothetical protein